MSKLYVSDVIRILRGEVGYKEKASNAMLDDPEANAGAGNWNKYARDLWAVDPHYYNGPKNGYDWCTTLPDWAILQACGRDAAKAQRAVYYTGPYGGSCTWSIKYYRAANAWYKEPKVGDQIFFGRSLDNARHTGMVVELRGDKVITIEGNARNAVRELSYSRSDPDILGYGRPAYDGQEPPEEEPPAPTEPSFPTIFEDVPGDAWFTGAVIWALENGLTAGIDATHFGPEQPFTRAEAFVLAKKIVETFAPQK